MFEEKEQIGESFKVEKKAIVKVIIKVILLFVLSVSLMYFGFMYNIKQLFFAAIFILVAGVILILVKNKNRYLHIENPEKVRLEDDGYVTISDEPLEHFSKRRIKGLDNEMYIRYWPRHIAAVLRVKKTNISSADVVSGIEPQSMFPFQKLDPERVLVQKAENIVCVNFREPIDIKIFYFFLIPFWKTQKKKLTKAYVSVDVPELLISDIKASGGI
jgi:hypothetical protein